MVSFLTLVASEHPTPQLLMREKQECNCSTKSLRKMTMLLQTGEVNILFIHLFSHYIWYLF